MDEIAIVLACDDRYAQHADVAAASMLLCRTDSRPLHFYLFDDGVEHFFITVESLIGQWTMAMLAYCGKTIYHRRFIAHGSHVICQIRWQLLSS